MSEFFIILYRFFRHNRWFFYLFMVVLIGFIVLFASRIRLEEDISGLTHGDAKLSRYEYVIRNFRFADKLVVNFSMTDTVAEADPDKLISAATALRDSLTAKLDSTCIRDIFLEMNDSLFQVTQDIMDKHLPLFLNEADYRTIDSMLLPGRMESILQGNYRMMVSPAGMIMKQWIARDPLGISRLALGKLATLRLDDQFTYYNDCVFSQDKKHLLMFITPAKPATETSSNAKLVSTLQRCIANMRQERPNPVSAEYFGFAATAVGNARQIKIDIFLTLAIALVLIFLLVGWYFRNFLVPLLGFVPAFFGGGLALAVLSVCKGNVSFIALGIGSVILGLIIDYALYLVNHYRRKKSVEQVLADMTHTILMCSLTTIGVFLCLTFLGSSVLHDLGWFASISVFGASICSLVILPQFLGKRMLPGENHRPGINFIDRVAAIDPGEKKWLLVMLAVAGIISIFVTGKVVFEKDLNSLNYMPEPLRNAEKHLELLSGRKFKQVYIVSTGKNPNEALKLNEVARRKLETLKTEGRIHDFSGIGALLLSDSLQRERLNKWHEFWTDERKASFISQLTRDGKKIGFSEGAFSGITSMLAADYTTIPPANQLTLQKALLSDWINETPEMTMVSSIAKVTEDEKPAVYESFLHVPGMVVFDRQHLTTRFVENVRADFELLVTLSMIFVTLLLLISLGRVELALITSLPMFISWLITLGFMGITGIRFNIFNIIISTFIFGLGVDYSILMMRGLLSRYKTGVDDMKTYRVSIILSSATTLIGVGALFFARHPALRSIALISVVGIVSVVIISITVQSFLAKWFLLAPLQRKSYPMTARNILQAVFIAWIPISLFAFILVIYGNLINPLLPLPKQRKQLVFHHFFRFLCDFYIKLNFPRYHAIEGDREEFQRKPAIIICNHQSLIDTPALLRLHPKIVILTSDWVFRNPVFGPVARVAGFIPVSENIDNSLALIKQRVDEGYSILIFPEGHRSSNGQIGRFHRGAFYIAEKLGLDILPLMLHGGGDFLPKGIFWGKPNRLFTQILPRITPDDHSFGTSYSMRSRLIRKYYREKYPEYKTMHNTPGSNAMNLRLNYVFKGPVLEWYLRVKMKLENNFETWCRLVPRQGDILDLGCGYGYISYMLMLTSDQRYITGVDYDLKKITVAVNGYLKNDRITFVHADVAEYQFPAMDAFLLGDILHYLPREKQQQLLARCISNLNTGGIILIREGNADMKTKHKRTKLTEFFSTRIIRFNQSDHGELCFLSEGILRKIAENEGLTFETIGQNQLTSNNFYAMRRP